MKYDKLVRDKIPQHIMEKGGSPITHIADEVEYWQKLKEKLQEEVTEFLGSENPEELADILEVVEAICEYKKIDAIELGEIKEQKAKRRGKFRDKIILEES